MPDNLCFKVSVHTGHGAPASFQLLEEISANSINTVGVLESPMISSARKVVNEGFNDITLGKLIEMIND